MIRDISEEGSLTEVDMLNIPMNCAYLSPKELGGKKWLFVADNYMPRKCRATKAFYQVEADTKEELVEYVKKYILPIYQEVIKELGGY